jgi:hypothetical protein
MARTSKEFQAFDSLMDRLLTVPKTELDRRQAEYRKQVDENPRRRGPKRKAVTPSADRDEDASKKTS